MNNDKYVDYYLLLLFKEYLEMQDNDELYSNESRFPQLLIELYYKTQNYISFDYIMSNYMKKYISNENKIENVHSELERAGLKEVYNYIQSDEWKNLPNIYVILKIHSLLYSKVPCSSFGGSYRVDSAFLSGGDVNTSEPQKISRDISALYVVYSELFVRGNNLKNSKEFNCDDLFKYIDDVIKLKCRLIEIHPFADGNGRTMRSLVNLLFKNIGLPPIYVKKEEKKEYVQAMDNAIRNKDYSSINKFYYYKICDSIIELDVGAKIEEDNIKRENEDIPIDKFKKTL